MSNSIQLCNGAFVATFEKGEKGKPGKWITKATGKVRKQKHSGKEQPQYKVIEDVEKQSVNRFNVSLKAMTLDIVQNLKTTI